MDIIVGTGRRIRRNEEGLWNEYVDEDKSGVLKTENNIKWWPTIVEQKEKIWEVEPEEIYVWYHCDDGEDGGSSVLYTTLEPLIDNSSVVFKQNGLFGKKMQKYKLVLQEDY